MLPLHSGFFELIIQATETQPLPLLFSVSVIFEIITQTNWDFDQLKTHFVLACTLWRHEYLTS